MIKFKHAGMLFDAGLAVQNSVRPSDPYAASGELELMCHKIERLASICGELTQMLFDKNALTCADVARLTEYAYEEVKDGCQ